MRKGVLCREFYDHAGKISHYQTVVPQHLRAEVLYRVHNSKLKAHNGVTKTIIEYRKQFYFPGFTEQVVNYIKNCLTCNQVKPVPKSLRTPPLQEMMTEVGLPAEALQIDIVGKLPDANGFKYISDSNRCVQSIPLCNPPEGPKCGSHSQSAAGNLHGTLVHPQDNHHRPRLELHISHDA